MRRSTRVLLLSLALLVAVGGAQALPAQSILGAGGLGIPVESLDAQARALGSVGLSLLEASLLPTDPTASFGLVLPTVAVSLQHTWSTTSYGADEMTGRVVRFPMIGLAYPVVRFEGMAFLTFGGFMDQDWAVREEGTVDLGGQSIPTRDTYGSEGGISSLKLGWAQRLGERFVVAGSLGTYTGEVTRTFIRALDTLDVVSDVSPYIDGGRWNFTGPTGTLGVMWDPVEIVRVSGSVTWSGTLKANPSEETKGDAEEFQPPLEFRVGAAASLTTRLAATANLSYSDWSGSGGIDPSAMTGANWSFGAGLEWGGARLGDRSMPLRFGYRRTDLPFRLGEDDPVESILAAGIGINLRQIGTISLARVDVAVERGSRDAGTLSETFTRMTVTLRLAGG